VEPSLRPPITVRSGADGLDLELIHGFLRESYWARGISREVVERAIRNSLCFAAFDGERQVGFARVVTDGATYGYLADVFVIETHRRRGIASRLMEAIDAHADLRGLRRFQLVTRDAHPLYATFGFTPLANPERHMERFVPDAYAR